MIENLVSVITPVFNAERYIDKTILSVLNQSYKNLELILVDDCSTDNSKDIILSMQKEDERIKYIKLKENSGAAVARNTGLENATGQYVAFIDSDDLWKKEKLSLQLQFMQDNNYGFTYTAFETLTENGTIQSKHIQVPRKINYSSLLKNTAIACSTVVIDKKITGDFRMPLVRKGQDTATWLYLLKKIDYAFGYDEVVSSYRKVSGSISSNKFSALKRTWNTYYNIENLPLYKAVYYFTFYTFNAVKKRL
ncbi:glycosyltransferase family 2 protein [Marinilactibacillus psychrotolerans]|uniref:glycosyltransferase family 2 protein n=1 Tax=Marinilactibacillus psychrotolerans TaxID=191770 RepID=UPI0038878977